MKTLNLSKYIEWGKKFYRRAMNRVVEVRAWRGPRGKSLCGTGKALARLAWDKKRSSSVTLGSVTPAQSQTPVENLLMAGAAALSRMKACWR